MRRVVLEWCIYCLHVPLSPRTWIQLPYRTYLLYIHCFSRSLLLRSVVVSRWFLRRRSFENAVDIAFFVSKRDTAHVETTNEHAYKRALRSFDQHS